MLTCFEKRTKERKRETLVQCGTCFHVKFNHRDTKAVILDRILSHRTLELAKTSLPTFVFENALHTV